MRDPGTQNSTDIHHRALRLWLLSVAALVFALVLVGGATRLTEFGLSIVEWKPLTGIIPPLSLEAWQAEFAKYQTIPQYAQLNRGMSLGDFQSIYWWEWTHRLLGRVVGVAFLLPLLWFLWRGWIERALQPGLWAIFGLGAIQGAVGWWMVASGLVGRVEVSQYRLATHLILACLIFAALLWAAECLQARPPTNVPRSVRAGAGILALAVLAQIFVGAIVAGLRAGSVYNTWPLIDGTLVPASGRLFFETPLWRNFFENALTAQFDHRMLAYGLLVLAVLHAIDAARHAPAAVAGRALAVAVLVVAQAVLGVVTLLQQAPLTLALAHQALAMVVLGAAAVHAARLRSGPRPSVALAAALSSRAVR